VCSGGRQKTFEPDDLAAGRTYVKAYVEFIHFVELLYDTAMKTPHGHFEERETPAKHDHRGRTAANRNVFGRRMSRAQGLLIQDAIDAVD
jgi:hypothetical protein